MWSVTSCTVAQVMIKGVVNVHAECSIEDVLVKFHLSRLSCIVVCEGQKPIGLISERDLVSLAFHHFCKGRETRRTAEEIMTRSIVTVRKSNPLDVALAVAAKNEVRHLPVVDADGALEGLLTEVELIRGSLEL